MNREKTAEFMVDCLAHMPDQQEEVQSVVDTAIAGLKRIANGGEWPADEAWAAERAAGMAAARTAEWAAEWAAARTAEWAAYWAAYCSAETADRAADYAARAHPDPDAERARQKAKREELGLNTKQEA